MPWHFVENHLSYPTLSEFFPSTIGLNVGVIPCNFFKIIIYYLTKEIIFFDHALN